MKSWCVDRWIPLSKIWYLFIIWRYHSQLDFGPCLLSLFLFTLYECNLFGIWHDFFMSNYKTHLIQCFNFGDNVFPLNSFSSWGLIFKPILSLCKVSEKTYGRVAIWPTHKVSSNERPYFYQNYTFSLRNVQNQQTKLLHRPLRAKKLVRKTFVIV